MPENLRKGRNTSITLSFVEFACCLLSFGFYDIERSRVLLAIICLTLFTTAGGLYAKVKLSYAGLLLHAAYSISVVGGFYIYIVIAYFFTTDSQHKGALSDVLTLVICSLPMFAIFIMGIYSVVLATMLEKETDARKKVDQARDEKRAEGKKKKKYQAVARDELVELEEQKMLDGDSRESTSMHADEHIIEVLELPEEDVNSCAICLDAEPDSVFYPCGHQCLCNPCGERFKKEARH